MVSCRGRYCRGSHRQQSALENTREGQSQVVRRGGIKMRGVEVYTKDVYELCKNGYSSRDVGEHYLGGMIREDDDIDDLTGEVGIAPSYMYR